MSTDQKTTINKGDTISLGGVKGKVLNLTEKTITVRPESPLLISIKGGVLLKISRVMDNGDVLLRVPNSADLEEFQRRAAQRT